MPFAQFLPSRKFSGKERQGARGNHKSIVYIHLMNICMIFSSFSYTGIAMVRICSGIQPKWNRHNSVFLGSGYFLKHNMRKFLHNVR